MAAGSMRGFITRFLQTRKPSDTGGVMTMGVGKYTSVLVWPCSQHVAFLHRCDHERLELVSYKVSYKVIYTRSSEITRLAHYAAIEPTFLSPLPTNARRVCFVVELSNLQRVVSSEELKRGRNTYNATSSIPTCWATILSSISCN